jgi:hypothetical protein
VSGVSSTQHDPCSGDGRRSQGSRGAHRRQWCERVRVSFQASCRCASSAAGRRARAPGGRFARRSAGTHRGCYDRGAAPSKESRAQSRRAQTQTRDTHRTGAGSRRRCGAAARRRAASRRKPAMSQTLQSCPSGSHSSRHSRRSACQQLFSQSHMVSVMECQEVTRLCALTAHRFHHAPSQIRIVDSIGTR